MYYSVQQSKGHFQTQELAEAMATAVNETIKHRTLVEVKLGKVEGHLQPLSYAQVVTALTGKKKPQNVTPAQAKVYLAALASAGYARAA